MSPFVVEIAGIAVGFTSDDPRWPAALAPRYGAFRSERAPDLAIGLETRGEVGGATDLARLADESIAIEERAGRITLSSESIDGWLEVGRGAGHLAAPVHRHGVDALLRALLAQIDATLLIHAALLAEGGRAYACSGPSGAGKSTLAALAGARAFCDELCLLRRTESGWRAEALPFWHGRPGGGALAGLRLLRHGDRHALHAAEAGEAARRLVSEIVWPTFSAAASERALALFERLVAEVPAAELEFRRSADFWSHLVGEAA